MPQWYAVKTKHWREGQTAANLAARGVDVFLPLLPGTTEPLFRGYLFIRVAIDTAEWPIARSAPGVAYVLGGVSGPTPLPDDLIARLRERIAGRRPVPFQAGDRVVITSRPFADIEAVFDRALSADGRVRVFLEFVSRIVPLDLDVTQLRRAG